MNEEVYRIESAEFTDCEIESLIATRPFLTTERLNGKRSRSSKKHPHIVVCDETRFVIDGHHKIFRAHLRGEETIHCSVIHAYDPAIKLKLHKMNHGPVILLEVKEK